MLGYGAASRERRREPKYWRADRIRRQCPNHSGLCITVGEGPIIPAVILYNSVLALESIGWIFLTGTAIRDKLTKNDLSISTMRTNRRNGYSGLALYSTLAVLAHWIPHIVVTITILTALFWLAISIYLLDKEHSTIP